MSAPLCAESVHTAEAYFAIRGFSALTNRRHRQVIASKHVPNGVPKSAEMASTNVR